MNSNYHKRQQKIQQTKDKLLIVCSGQTEELYFNFLKEKFKNGILKITIDVISHKRNTPMTIVNKAIEYKSEYQEIWAVFDKDETNDFDEAIRLALYNNIKCAFSNRQIEYWFLLHFVDTTSNMNRDNLLTAINKHINFEFKKDPETLKKIYKIIFKNMFQAEKRAKIGYIKHKAKPKSNPSDWCSCTTVYQLTETLRMWFEAK